MSVVLTGTESTVVEDHCSSNLKVCFSLLPGNDCVRLFFRRRKWGGERRLYYFQLKESWGLLRLYPEGVAAQLSYLKYMHTVNMHK